MTANDLLRHIRRNGGKEKRQTGSHVICELPDHSEIVIPQHNHKDLGKGLACKILKALALAGIPYAVWVVMPYVAKTLGLV